MTANLPQDVDETGYEVPIKTKATPYQGYFSFLSLSFFSLQKLLRSNDSSSSEDSTRTSWSGFPQGGGRSFCLEPNKDRAGPQDKDCHCLRRTASEELPMLVFFFFF